MTRAAMCRPAGWYPSVRPGGGVRGSGSMGVVAVMVITSWGSGR